MNRIHKEAARLYNSVMSCTIEDITIQDKREVALCLMMYRLFRRLILT